MKEYVSPEFEEMEYNAEDVLTTTNQQPTTEDQGWGNQIYQP
jgi:hypothetical protein